MYRRKYTPAQRKAIAAAYARKKRTYSRPTYRGSGDYKLYVPSKTRKGGFDGPRTGSMWGETIGSLAGNYLAPGIGGAVGKPLGNAVGRLAGLAVRKLTGYGNYSVDHLKSNSLLGATPATFGDAHIRIKNREFCWEVEGSTGFRNDFEAINPSNAKLFPWLSAISNNFQQYEFHGLVFEFVSLSYNSSAAASTSTGSVLMCVNYDAAAPEFTDLVEGMQYPFANLQKPTRNFPFAVECSRADSPYRLLYTSTAPAASPPSNVDPKTLHLGNLNFIVDGMPSGNTGVIGLLFASYDVSFHKTKANSVVGTTVLCDHFYGINQTNVGSLYFNLATPMPGSSLGGQVSSGYDSYEFPPNLGTGRYMIVYYCYAETTLAVDAPTISLTNCEAVDWWIGGTAQNITNEGPTDNVLFSILVVDITGEDASFTFTGGDIPKTTDPNWDLVITQIPKNINPPTLTKTMRKGIKSLGKIGKEVITLNKKDHSVDDRIKLIEKDDEGPLKEVVIDGQRYLKL